MKHNLFESLKFETLKKLNKSNKKHAHFNWFSHCFLSKIPKLAWFHFVSAFMYVFPVPFSLKISQCYLFDYQKRMQSILVKKRLINFKSIVIWCVSSLILYPIYWDRNDPSNESLYVCISELQCSNEAIQFVFGSICVCVFFQWFLFFRNSLKQKQYHSFPKLITHILIPNH